jgi:hypothetical protein
MHTDMSYDTFYTWHFPLLSPFLLTWHPPVVTGIVHLSPRLLVNCPLCPHGSLVPFPPQIPNPLGFPGPNVLLIRAHYNPLSSIQHSSILQKMCAIIRGFQLFSLNNMVDFLYNFYSKKERKRKEAQEADLPVPPQWLS